MITTTYQNKESSKKKMFFIQHTSPSFWTHCQPCFDCNYELSARMRIRNLLRIVLRTNYTKVYFYIIAIHILNNALSRKASTVDTPIN